MEEGRVPIEQTQKTGLSILQRRLKTGRKAQRKLQLEISQRKEGGGAGWGAENRQGALIGQTSGRGEEALCQTWEDKWTRLHFGDPA